MTMRLASKAREKAALPKDYRFGDANDTRHYRRLFDAAKKAEPKIGDPITYDSSRPSGHRFVFTALRAERAKLYPTVDVPSFGVYSGQGDEA